MLKIALTSQGPFHGCTTIGEILEKEYLYKHLNMSDQLIWEYAHVHRQTGCSVKDVVKIIKNNKDAYRQRLADFADSIDFDSLSLFEPTLMQILNRKHPGVVIEKIRTDEQAKRLKDWGYTLIEIHRPGIVAPRGLKREQGICTCIERFHVTNTNPTHAALEVMRIANEND